MNEEDKKILEIARERFSDCMSEQSEFRKDAIDDIRFARLSEQWSAGDKDLRGDRPMLTMNKTEVFINSAVNEIKQARNKPKARGVDNAGDKILADIRSAIIDHIFSKGGESAVDTAVEYAVTCGMGAFRIITEKEENGVDQKICIKRISNPFRVVIPFHECEESDFSDAPYGFIITKIKKDDFKKRYPKIDLHGWEALGEGMGFWQDDKNVTIAEYFDCEYSGEDYKDKKITWYKLCGNAILDKTEWPGSYIPIIMIMGPEVDLDGRKTYKSLTRNAKDPQRFFNYAKSAEAEVLGLAPKSPWVAAEGQIEGREKMWNTANKVAYGVLTYKPQSVGGQLLPQPQRVASVQIPTGLANASREASDDLKACIGMWDASLGAQGNETSGVAIKARARQGSTANFHFYDNTNKALEYMGRQLLELIPKVVTTPTQIRIVGEDRKEEIIRINEEYERNGKLVKYDMSEGEFDIIMDTGPSYASRRQEVEENISTLMQRLPPVMASAIADIFVRNMDFPDSQAMADRLKNLVPPEAMKKEGDDKINPAMVQQIMQQLEQKDQVIQAMDKTIQEMDLELKNKSKDRQLEIDKALLSSETQLEIASMKSAFDELKIHHNQLQEQIRSMQSQAVLPAVPVQNTELPPEGEIEGV